MSRVFVFLAVTLFLTGCDDQSSSFDSRQAAEEIIEKGWLPPSMPESASEIWETHNLDINKGRGEFVFDAKDAPAFRRALRAIPTAPRRCNVPWAEMIREGREWYIEEDFFLAIDWKESDVKFWLCYQAGV